MLVANQKSPYLFFEINVHVPFSDDTCVIHMCYTHVLYTCMYTKER